MQLEAKNVGFRYGNGPWLFRGVSVSIKPGEIVGVTGPSGRGKTTFCRLLAGYEQPTEGTITFNELSAEKNEYHPVQLIFQHPEKAVNPKWKINKILNEGWQPDKELLSFIGIEEEWLTRWPSELSGGELQRICIARALGPNTRLLIADEMTTMLDAITQAQIWRSVIEIAEKRGMGLLIVSHETQLMQRLCQRVIDFNDFSDEAHENLNSIGAE